MQLKLLGVLQDYGSPFASLYIDNDEEFLYLAIQQESTAPKMFTALLMRVTSSMIDEYMQNAIGLRQISRLSSKKYIWNRTKGEKGTIISIGQNDVSERIDEDDDMFDSFFCQHESSIRYYVNQYR